MRRFVTIVILCIGCLMTASAQTFTQRIQQRGKAGEGTVTVTQAKAIVEHYGGTIYARSPQGSGMGIYIQLPARV